MHDNQRPVVLLLKGLPCSGKSTLADAISRVVSWVVVDKDDGRDCLSVLKTVPSTVLNSLSYDIIYQVAERQVLLLAKQTTRKHASCLLAVAGDAHLLHQYETAFKSCKKLSGTRS